MTKTEYEAIAVSLVGEIIQSVEYFEINYESYQSAIDLESEIHSLDFGVNLKMISGKVFGFIWGSEFFHHGVSILKTSLKSEVDVCREVDVSESIWWNPLVGKEIIRTEVE